MLMHVYKSQHHNLKRNCLKKHNYNSALQTVHIPLADPGGGGTPNGRGPMIFLCPKRLIYVVSIFLRSRLILSIILIEIGPKHSKNDFYFNLQHFTFNNFQSPFTPTPVD